MRRGLKSIKGVGSSHRRTGAARAAPMRRGLKWTSLHSLAAYLYCCARGPDEKGTEIVHDDQKNKRRRVAARAAPMRRGLKSKLGSAWLKAKLCRARGPDEKGTEIRAVLMPTEAIAKPRARPR